MRINVIHPKHLADQHLLAEYREIKMLPKMLHRSLHSKRGVQYHKIPREYTLNKGHGKFFYNKLIYIQRRFDQILSEMSSRGFKTNFDVLIPDKQISDDLEQNPFVWYDWEPDDKAVKVNVERILLRISQKPAWYKMKGIIWGFISWKIYYRKNLIKPHILYEDDVLGEEYYLYTVDSWVSDHILIGLSRYENVYNIEYEFRVKNK